MKTIIALILLPAFAFAQQNNSSGENASIKVVDSVHIYMQSIPTKDFEVVGDVLPAGMNMHMDSMDHLCEHFIKRAQKKYPGVQFDALVFLNNWRAQVIRYRKNKS